MFENLKEKAIIIGDWDLWCDEQGNLWCRGIPYTVLEEREYCPEEKTHLINEMKIKCFECAKTSLEEKGPLAASFDTERLERHWNYEYNTRKKYLPEILPDWMIAGEDIDLLAANICTKTFVNNIKKYSGKQTSFFISYNVLFPEEEVYQEGVDPEDPVAVIPEEVFSGEYLKNHPYIRKSMECFVSMKWGCWDFPGGEILRFERDSDCFRIICSRRDDWEWKICYTCIEFLNCILLKNEYDNNIITYEDEEGFHSNISLCPGEISESQKGRCRFSFLIADEYGIYYDLILDCEDVSVTYSDNLWSGY